MKNIILLFSCCFLFIQCKTEVKTLAAKNTRTTSAIKYAQGFDIVSDGNLQKLIIKKTFYNSTDTIIYLLSDKTNSNKNEIKVPVEKLVATSTTHIPMLELLNATEKLIGFPNTKYISSKKTRQLIDKEKITDLGNAQDMNTEVLLALQPELVIGFSLSSNNRVYNSIKKAEIPVIFNGDWLEETPLGRAEWIKFFGVLLNKQQEADSIFSSIEKEYLKTKKLALQNKSIPTILSGNMFQDIWNVPAGESYMATFFKDANLNYIWKNTAGKGSLQLNFESFLDQGKEADFWIDCGNFDTKKQMLSANNLFIEFNAFQKGNLFSTYRKRNENGGLLFYELSTVRPDLVLKDLIKITQPELLLDHELTFFGKLD